MMHVADQAAQSKRAGWSTTNARARLKQGLALAQREAVAQGATLLIYHRIGAGTTDELDVPADGFARHVRLLEGHDVVALDVALDRLDAGDMRHSVVLTFDDGFEDVYARAWPLMRDRGLPFTIYLASGFMSQPMRWEGSTAKGAGGRGMSWTQLAEMVDSGLCTVGNHTHRHVRPGSLTVEELDECTETVRSRLGVTPTHFTYPWGIPVPAMEDELKVRFRSASTGELGRNHATTDRMRLMRVPVRQSDPDAFFAAKLRGRLGPERAYAGAVRLGKAVGLRA
jgi:peptidoglycan/xylan/chitin deacetylase (PgdA/CDA1 family)